MSTYIIGITGASGSIYAETLLKALILKGHTIYLSISEPGLIVLKQELSWDLKGNEKSVEGQLKDIFNIPSNSQVLRYFAPTNIGGLIASGSFICDGMIIIPCSMSTLSGVANGYSNNLIERAADVTLKEGRPLIVVPRETPLNQVHLRNMLTLSQMGVHIVPAMPAFYNQPKTIADLADFIAGRVLDLLSINQNLYKRWQG